MAHSWFKNPFIRRHFILKTNFDEIDKILRKLVNSYNKNYENVRFDVYQNYLLPQIVLDILESNPNQFYAIFSISYIFILV